MSYRAKGLPWHNVCREDVKDCATAREVMEKAGLDWIVAKCPLYAQMPIRMNDFDVIGDNNDSFIHDMSVFSPAPKAYGTFRVDNNIPLGTVKSKYEVVQNVDAFSFFDNVIGNDVEWQNAGYCGNGEQVYVTAKLPNLGDVNGDKIDQYLVFGNSHDGSTSVDIMLTPIRVACTNMLNAGIDKSYAHIRLRHTKNVSEKLEIGSEVLRVACLQAQDALDVYRGLEAIAKSDDEILQFLVSLNLSKKELDALNLYDSKNGAEKLIMGDYRAIEETQVSTRKRNIIVSMYDYYKTGIGQEEIAGTAWGAYNAVTGYYSNVANIDGDKRMQSLLYGNACDVSTRALNLLTAKVA